MRQKMAGLGASIGDDLRRPSLMSSGGEEQMWICVQASSGYALCGEADPLTLEGNEVFFHQLGAIWFATVWPYKFRGSASNRPDRLEPALFEQILRKDVEQVGKRIHENFVRTIKASGMLLPGLRESLGASPNEAALGNRLTEGLENPLEGTANFGDEGDLRTMAVNYRKGRRFKTWRETVEEST